MDKTCEVCNNVKQITDFGKSSDGDVYEACRDCWLAKSREFWSNKKFKLCRACSKYQPVRNFDFNDKIPYPDCRECFETKMCDLYNRRQEEGFGKIVNRTAKIRPAPYPTKGKLPKK